MAEKMGIPISGVGTELFMKTQRDRYREVFGKEAPLDKSAFDLYMAVNDRERDRYKAAQFIPDYNG